MSKRIPLVESFGPTIQGEGAVIGYQTIFLRFGGCDYKCTRCDSLHAVLPKLFRNSARYLTQEEILIEALLIAKHCEWITLSGGNPCMHDLSALVKGLKLAGKKIAVETQGTLWQDWLMDCDHVTVSPKGPGMGEEFDPYQFKEFMLELGNHPDLSIKVVIFGEEDLEFTKVLLQDYSQHKEKFFLSIGNIFPPAPAKRGTDGDEELDNEEISRQNFIDIVLTRYKWIIKQVMEMPELASCRILPQLHTLLWGNDKGK